MDPRAVIVIADVTASPGTSAPITVDSSGALRVSAPVGTSGLGVVSEANVDIFGIFQPSATETALLTNSAIYATDSVSGLMNVLFSSNDSVDNDPEITTGVLVVLADQRGFNGTSFDRVRVANVFKSVAATAAGNTAVWTPAAGKKFRLMGYSISIAGTVTVALVNLIKLTDAPAGTIIAQNNAAVGAAVIAGGDTQIENNLGQGFLSALANNVLTVNLSSAMLTGSVIVNAWGTEE